MPTFDLRLGDCLEVMRELPDNSVDAVVTDPPYGMSWNTNTQRFSGGRVKSRRGKDWGKMIFGDGEPFNPDTWIKFERVVLFGYNHFAQRLPVGTTLVWVKKMPSAYGTFLSDAEVAWMKGGHGVYCHHEEFGSFSRAREAGGAVAHPTQKPVGLMMWALAKAKVSPGMTVLDPYMGSGSTGVACMRAGVNFIGIERDAEYFAIAEKRISAAAAQGTLALDAQA